jgi:hypothetical protein
LSFAKKTTGGFIIKAENLIATGGFKK